MPPSQFKDIRQGALDNFGFPFCVIQCFFGCLAVVNAALMRLCFDLVAKNGIELQRPNKKTNKFKTFHNVLPETNHKDYQTFQQQNRLRSAATTTTVKKYKLQKRAQKLTWLAFYVGYVLMNVPGGLIADKYNAKWLLASSAMLSACFAFLTPVIIRCRQSSLLLLMLWRFLCGMAEGPTQPALNAVLYDWCRREERIKLSILIFSASQIGIFVVQYSWHTMLKNIPWENVFYVCSALPTIWTIGFILLCSISSAGNPQIYSSDLLQFSQELGNYKTTIPPTTPWLEIFQNSTEPSLITSAIDYDWNQEHAKFKVVNQEQPTSFSQNFALTFYPFIVSWLMSQLTGPITDLLISIYQPQHSTTRQLMRDFAEVGLNIASKMISCHICSGRMPTPKQHLLQSILTLLSNFYADIKVAPFVIIPNYVSSKLGLFNNFGSSNSTFSPFLHSFASAKQFLNKFQTTADNFGSLIWLVTSVFLSDDNREFNNPLT